MHVILNAREGIVEPFLDERDSQMCDINADPLPSKLLGHVNRGPTAAEGVQDYITFLATGVDDPFQERQRFLRGIA